MKVWIVNPFDNLPGEGYRPGRYELMARAFAAAGHDVTWMTSDWSHARKCRRDVPESVTPNFRLVLQPGHIRPYRANVSLERVSNHFWFAYMFRSAMMRTKSVPSLRPDLVIVSMPPLSVGVEALKLRASFGFRLVVDVQDAWPETFARLLPRGLRWMASVLFAPLRWKARRLYREADLVTGVCDSYAPLVRKAGAKAYHRAYLGIAPSAGRARAARAPAAPRARKGLRFAYVGNLGRSVDLATVVRAIEEIPGATLHVAGNAQPRTEGRVTFYGYLNDAALAELLASCDVGVVPMRVDSFVGIPNKVADYAAAGLPVVSSLAGECAELLERTRAGVFYEPGDAASFVLAANDAVWLDAEGPRRLLRELDADRIYADYVRLVSTPFREESSTVNPTP